MEDLQPLSAPRDAFAPRGIARRADPGCHPASKPWQPDLSVSFKSQSNTFLCFKDRSCRRTGNTRNHFSLLRDTGRPRRLVAVENVLLLALSERPGSGQRPRPRPLFIFLDGPGHNHQRYFFSTHAHARTPAFFISSKSSSVFYGLADVTNRPINAASQCNHPSVVNPSIGKSSSRMLSHMCRFSYPPELGGTTG